MASPEDIRHWLRENRYDDVADKIDKVMQHWAKQGNGARKNWWPILAGGKAGRPRIVAGVEFPVLRVAQLRHGLPVTPNAIKRGKNETAPEIRTNGRWSKSAHGK